jgi:hypothetical protein
MPSFFLLYMNVELENACAAKKLPVLAVSSRPSHAAASER